MLVLKALGNIGHLTHEAIESVYKCVEKSTLPVRVRVAAAQAMRRLPCNENEDDENVRVRYSPLRTMRRGLSVHAEFK